MIHQQNFVNNNKDRTALDAAKQKLPEYLESMGLDTTKNMLCLFHAEDKPSMGLAPDGLHVHCFSCGVTADLVDVIAQVEGLTPRSKEAIDRTIEWAGTGCVGNAPRGKSKSESTKRPSPKTKPSAGQNTSEPPPEPPNFHEYIEQCSQHFDEPDCRAYLESRGFGDADFEKLRSFRLGFDVERRLLIIPHSDLYYTARPIDPVDKAERFKHNPKGAKAEIFNVAALETNEVVVVCEGAIDALSLIACGIPAVGLPGVHNCHKQLIDAIIDVEHPFSTVARINLGLIVAFDKDKSGEDATNSLIQKLNKVEALYDSVSMPDGANDINDAFKADRDSLISRITPVAADLQSSIDMIRDIRIARSEPSVIFNRICKNAIDFPDSDISSLVFEEVALIASAVAAEKLPAEYSAYRNFVKEHGVDMSLFNEQVKKYRKKESEENNIIVPIKPGVSVNPYAPPEFDSQGDLPPLPNGEQWNFTLEGNYQIDRDGIYKLVENRLGGLEWKHISHSAIYISKFIQNIDDGTHRLQLSAYNHGYGWTSSPALPASDFGSSYKINNLGDWGFDINSNNAKDIIDYLSSFKAVNALNIPRLKTVNRPGWQKDGSFIYPNTDGEVQLDESVATRLDPIFQSDGDRQPVIDLLKSLSVSPVFNLTLGAALAAPLIKILRCQNVAVHVYGNTGSGKSSVNNMVMSLFADSHAKGALAGADATKSGLEFFFDSRHDLPAIVEDIDAVSDDRARRIVRDLPYQFVNQVGRLRSTKNGGNAPLIEFRGSLIVNGERPLTTATSTGGGKRRLIEYHAPDHIFDADTCKRIDEVTRENFGLFGRQWCQYCREYHDDIYNVFKECRDKFHSHFSTKIPLHRDNIAACATALIAFNWMINPEASEETKIEHVQSVLDWAHDILTKLPDEIEIKDSERAKDFIREWIAGHTKNFTYQIFKQDDPTTPFSECDSGFSGYEKFGAWRKDYIAIFPSTLHHVLETAGFSPDIIFKELANEGFLLHDKGHTTKLVRIDDIRIRMICIDVKHINVDDGSGDTSVPKPPKNPSDDDEYSPPKSYRPLSNRPLSPDAEAAEEARITAIPEDKLPPPPDEEYWAALLNNKNGKSEPKDTPASTEDSTEPTQSQEPPKKQSPETEKLQQLGAELSRRVIDENDEEAAREIECKIDSYCFRGNLILSKVPDSCEDFVTALNPIILAVPVMKARKTACTRLRRLFKEYHMSDEKNPRLPESDSVNQAQLKYALPTRYEFETMPEPKD